MRTQSHFYPHFAGEEAEVREVKNDGAGSQILESWTEGLAVQNNSIIIFDFTNDALLKFLIHFETH